MRVMKNKGFVLLPVAIVALACTPHVRTNVTPLDPSLHLAKTCPDGVKLYTSPDRVESPYREVGVINSKGQLNGSNESDMVLSMREEAGALGANGILLAEIEEPNPITKVAAGVGEVTLPRTGKATAIYVAADSANSVAACANYKGPSWLQRHFFW
jgi:hypothetical protein